MDKTDVLPEPSRRASERISFGIPKSSRWHRSVPNLIMRLALLALLGVLVVLPIVRLQLKAVSNGAAGYRTALNIRSLWPVIFNTIGLALGSLVIAMTLGTILAALATRLPRRLQWLSVLPMLPIVMPTVANVTGWAFLFAPRAGYLNAAIRALPFVSGESGPVNIYTIPWIIIVTGFGLTPFPYVFVRTGLSNINNDLIEAAQVSGSGLWRSFISVTLPLLRPVLIYGGAIALLLGLGQFTAPLLLGTDNNVDVLTTKMYRFTSDFPIDYGAAAAIGSPLLVVGILIVLLQRAGLGDESRFVTQGGKGVRMQSRPKRWVALPIAIYCIVAVVLPLAAVVVVALSPFYSSHVDVSSFTLQNFVELFDTPFVVGAIKTSVFASVVGTVAALIIGYLSAIVLYSSRWPGLRRAIDLFVNLPLGVPAVVMGAGFLFTYSYPPLQLYGTPWVIVLVYLTLMLPYGTRLILASRMSLGAEYESASRVAGAGVLRTHVETLLPLLRPAIGGAGALMFVLLTHEFSASLLVRSGTTQVMGTKLFDLWSTGSYPQVAAMALVMTGITAAGVCLAFGVSGGSNPLEKL